MTNDAELSGIIQLYDAEREANPIIQTKKSKWDILRGEKQKTGVFSKGIAGLTGINLTS